MAKKIDISIVIVNYRVKEYVSNLLSSIYKAARQYKVQIFVVDNDSGDDSVAYLRQRHPGVIYIANEDNFGFGKANNQAIKEAKGEFTLIINPDTLVSEDTFTVLIEHMKQNPKCGAAGCKILNPDGSFAPESKRSVPTIWAALTKLLGLHSIFPKSRLFGQYYLTWLSENQQAEINVLSGSFMFWRTELLQQMGALMNVSLCTERILISVTVYKRLVTILIMFHLLPLFIIKERVQKREIYAIFKFSTRPCICSLTSIIPLDIVLYLEQ